MVLYNFWSYTIFGGQKVILYDLYVMGANGSDKTDETEKVSDLVWLGSKPNRTNLNQSSLVPFLLFNFEIQ